MTTNCSICNKYIWDAQSPYMTCKECIEQREKLSDETFDWLMRLIENRVEKAIDEHTSKYEHTSTGGYY